MTPKQKVQCIDGFASYTNTPHKTMYASLVVPVKKKRIPKDIHIKVIAAQIRQNLLAAADKFNGKVRIVGKPQYYPNGNWDDKESLYSFITLDLYGEDADILERGIIEYRINGYFNMKYEDYLHSNMRKLGIPVKHATIQEDSIKKADLVLYKDDKTIGISVYKSTDEVALNKLRDINVNQFDVRYAYNVYKYGNPKDIKNVQKWWGDCTNNKNIIHLETGGLKYII